ncbi:MAG TPA: outer membrane protein assembly factor BamA [Oligoflexia bacterium]|nr:outer membrane protein assembly factor BamA [Oligoflexia bacterium]HMP27120.1 outer membrane protein assembly factor BamA [Oligoflexia bacterium]
MRYVIINFSFAVAIFFGALLSLQLVMPPAMAQDKKDQLVDIKEKKSLSGEKIVAVQIEGNRRIDLEALRLQINSKPGQLDRAKVSDDVKTLYNTGFFDQVVVSLVTPEKGKSDFPRGSGYILKFSLSERPVVRKILVQGNKEIKESQLEEVFRLGANRFLDRARIDALIKQGVSYYQSRGFYDVNIDYAVTPVMDDQVDLTFKITEGDKFKIKEIRFVGINKLSESDLLSEIETRRYKWWSSWLLGTGRVNQAQLDNDQIILRQYLLDNGFIEGNVSAPVITRLDNRRMLVEFRIEEGPQYKIGQIAASGDLIDGDSQKTIDGVSSKVGEIFSAKVIREDAFKISEKFTDRGYAFVNVVPNTNVDQVAKLVNLDFSITQGNPVNIRRINIRGTEKTYDNVVRREMMVDEQDLYSSSKLKRSQQRLERTGLFQEVSVSTEPTNEQDKVDVNVGIKEAQTGNFSIGGGYASQDGFLFTSRISEANLFGTGRSLTALAEAGGQRNQLSLGFFDPRINDSNISGRSQGFRTEYIFQDFNKRFSGGNLSFGYNLDELFGEWADGITANLKYELMSAAIVNINNESAADFVKQSAGSQMVSAITPSLLRNTINNPFNPVSGSRQSLSFEQAGLGGEADYYIIESRNAFFWPLFRTTFGDIVFSFRAEFDYGKGRGDDGRLPLFKRYFAGGINSIRGFRARALSPKDENGNEFGGNKQFVSNFDLIFPLFNSIGLRGVVFYDFGNVFDDNQKLDFGELREAAGVGLRWNSPLGPLRVEFGFPRDRDPGDRQMVTLFSFGAPF